MKTKTKLSILLIFALLTCSIVSANSVPRHSGEQIGEYEEYSGNEATVYHDYKGELVGKIEDQKHGLYYVELYNEDEDVSYCSLQVSKNKFKGAQMGKDYEWEFIRYPDGMESISFHRI